MKVTVEIYPKEIKKLLELLDLIDKKPEYIYKGDSSRSKEPIPIANHEVKKSAEPFSRKITDIPDESVKYNEKEPLPNKELDQSVQEVVNDLSGKEKLPRASNYAELEELLNDKKTKDKDSSTIKSDIPFHDDVYDSEQLKNVLEKWFDEVFGTDNTKD